MRLLTNRLTLLIALCVGFAQASIAAPDRDRESGPSSAPAPYSYSGGGPAPGNCSLGTAENDLDVNSVLARVFNTGSLFFGNSTTAGNGYLVPQASAKSPIFASGIWIGGIVDGEIRVAGARYTRYELWPGPLNDDGTLPNPADCSEFDRIYRVAKTDIQNYASTGIAARDLADWPAELGAPVLAAPNNGIDDNGNGEIDEGTDGIDNNGNGLIDERAEQELRIDGGYDLAAGDRPNIIGDQALWWVMNDVGNIHEETGSNPLGVEVQVHAFSFARADALGETTFYQYTVINKSGVEIDDTYLSVFSDPDLGDAADDWVGADTTLSVGYVYNGGPEDSVYGIPPAEGYDFFQGPIVDLDGDGMATDTLGLTRFTYFCNGCPEPATQDPRTKEEYYNHMLGLWKDGTPYTASGFGYLSAGEETKFVFPGDPVTDACWSMANNCEGGSVQPNDQRLIVHTGPFVLEPGVPQSIVFGIIHGQGGSNLESVSALRAADQIAQAAYDANFELAAPPPAPPLCNANSTNPELLPGSGFCMEAVEQSGRLTLVWGYPTNSDNYLNSYTAINRLLPSGDDTYDFEGYNIYQYPTSGFNEGDRQLIATYDVVNGVTLVRDERFDAGVGVNVPFIAARGTDSGIPYYHEVDGLTNNTDYYYGISAYAYINNDLATGSRIIESAPRQIRVRPSNIAPSSGGAFTQSMLGTTIEATRIEGGGQGLLGVTVIDPTAIQNAIYTMRFYQFVTDAGETLTTYDILRGSDVVLNGQEAFEDSGALLGGVEVPYDGVASQNVIVDGIQFFTTAPDPSAVVPAFDADRLPDFSGSDVTYPPFEALGLTGGGIIEVANPSGSPCPQAGNYGCDTYDGEGSTVWHTGNVSGDYYMTAGGGAGTIDRLMRYVESLPPDIFEMRFTAAGGYAQYGFASGAIVSVPFELWNVGLTPDDPSDDVRFIPFLNANGVELTDWENQFTGLDAWADSPCVGGCPVSDWVYYMAPDRPNGYDLWKAAADGFGGVGAIYDDTADGDTQEDIDPLTGAPCAGQGNYIAFCYRNQDFGLNGGASSFIYPIGRTMIADLDGDGLTPPEGTVIRLLTTPQPAIAAGDVFTFDTADFALVTDDAAIAEESLDLIQIVPNPYMGQSAYETGNLSRVVRFTNLPQEVTIRVYTVSGTLIKTFTKDGPSRSLDWNLTTERNLPIASGMYLIHVDVPGVGERVLKFGVVQRRTRITVF